MNVHPDVVNRLHRFLFEDEMRGVGFSEFISRALDRAEFELKEARERDSEPSVV
jgi:hypothetical protein